MFPFLTVFGFRNTSLALLEKTFAPLIEINHPNFVEDFFGVQYLVKVRYYIVRCTWYLHHRRILLEPIVSPAGEAANIAYRRWPASKGLLRT